MRHLGAPVPLKQPVSGLWRTTGLWHESRFTSSYEAIRLPTARDILVHRRGMAVLDARPKRRGPMVPNTNTSSCCSLAHLRDDLPRT